eukprot:8056815-Pyramimonas_sp.AAC.1
MPPQSYQPDMEIKQLSEMVKMLCQRQTYNDTRMGTIMTRLQQQTNTSASNHAEGGIPNSPSSIPAAQPCPPTLVG